MPQDEEKNDYSDFFNEKDFIRQYGKNGEKYIDASFLGGNVIEFIQANIEKSTMPHAWKCHVSVNKNNVGEAVSLIFPLLANNGIEVFKVARPSALAETDGRVITIYFVDPKRIVDNYFSDKLNRNVELDARAIIQLTLQEIENALSIAGILTGIRVRADQEVTGSQYLSYRCDYREINQKRIYVSEEDAISFAREERTSEHNPFNYLDEFGFDRMEVAETPEIVLMKEQNKLYRQQQYDLCKPFQLSQLALDLNELDQLRQLSELHSHYEQKSEVDSQNTINLIFSNNLNLSELQKKEIADLYRSLDKAHNYQRTRLRLLILQPFSGH